MSKIEQARKLLAEATPRPWHSDHTGRLFGDAGGGEYESIIRRERICCGSNTALLVAAVNQYAALLDVVEQVQWNMGSGQTQCAICGGWNGVHRSGCAVAKWEELV